jgi:DNA-binding NtrC family response regulator
LKWEPELPFAKSSDITIPEIEIPALDGASSNLRITVLYHPDAHRIGQVADLPGLRAGESVHLSRLEPDFRFLRGDPECGPLLDPYLSRSPLVLQLSGADLEIRAAEPRSSLRVDGEAIAGNYRIPESRLQTGVSLMLARRVVLLLRYSQCPDIAEEHCQLIGECDALQRIRSQVCRVAASSIPVLILGESGTGKELVARAVHDHSERCGSTLLAVNMAAIPAELAAAELFGVSRGAYTGADSSRPGHFQRAAGSSLFLDEIGACAASVQPQLLRALQEGEVQIPGGGVEKVDTRIIAATDADFNADSSGFSLALKHRLAGFEIHLPPLRERVEDIGRLVRHMLPETLAFEAEQDPLLAGQWSGLLEDFAAYDWPGNVRELINFCEQISLASSSAGELVIPENIARVMGRHRRASREPAQNNTEQTGVYHRAGKFSDGEVREAMASAQWEISRAARELAVSRQALYRRIETIPGLRLVADIPSAEVEEIYHECRGELELAAARLQVSRPGLIRRWRALELMPDDY